MQFDKLLTSAGLNPTSISGGADVDAVVYDSRKAAPGTCFVAVCGSSFDGHDFIANAIEGGCSAIVAQKSAGIPEDTPHAIVDDTHLALGLLAQAIQGNPAQQLVKVGITGTNGKTTIAHLIYSILESAGRKSALLGTVGYNTGARAVESNATTPDPVTLAEATREMVDAGLD